LIIRITLVMPTDTTRRLIMRSSRNWTAISDRLLKLQKEAGIWDDTIIIISADHGGIGKGHGGKTLQELETPFIVSGKNVKRIPEFKESMMQFDIAATIAYIFDLKTPQVWIGRPMKHVFK